MAEIAFKKILPFLEGQKGEQRLIRFWAKVDKRSVDECWNWKAGLDGNGYGRFKIASYWTTRANRVALASSTMQEPKGKLALHHCDNPACCNPAHLYWGTHADNAKDKVTRGRAYSGDQSGANNGAAKLNEEQVALVVQRLKDGWNNKQIAADLPITHSMVSKIRLGEFWAEHTAALGWEPKRRIARHTLQPAGES